MEKNKNNKVYRYSKENKNKLAKIYDNEFAFEYDEDDKQLSLQKQQIRMYTKSNKANDKKDKNCK